MHMKNSFLLLKITKKVHMLRHVFFTITHTFYELPYSLYT